MSINIEALKSAASKIEQLGQGELTFSTGTADLTIRALKAHEELEVEKYGQVAWDEATGEEDRSALAAYLDRMRTATLAYVIVQIDDVDLRGTEFIETGETTPEGEPIRKPRHEVMRGLIREWNRHILHLCYLKYAELMQQIELAAGKAIKFDVTDTEAEIARLQKRLDELHKLKRDAEVMQEKTTHSTQVREAVKGLGEQHEERVETLQKAATEVEAARAAAKQVASYSETEPPESPVFGLGPYRSAIPSRAPAPQRVREKAPSQPPVETDASGISRPHEGDSMFDPADGDAALRAEHARLLEHRRHMQGHHGSEPPVIPSEEAPPTGRRAPHREALNTADAVVSFNDGEEVRERPKGMTAEVQGYRLPTEMRSIQTRGQGTPPGREATAPVNKRDFGSRNPRFKGSQT